MRADTLAGRLIAALGRTDPVPSVPPAESLRTSGFPGLLIGALARSDGPLPRAKPVTTEAAEYRQVLQQVEQEATRLFTEIKEQASETFLSLRQSREQIDNLLQSLSAGSDFEGSLSPLIQQRAELESQIEDLRAFEREYRTRLKAYMEAQLRELDTPPVGASQLAWPSTPRFRRPDADVTTDEAGSEAGEPADLPALHVDRGE